MESSRRRRWPRLRSIEAPPYVMDEEEVPPEQRQSLALSVFEMKDGSFAYTAATGAVFRNSAGKNHVSLRTGTEGQASRRGLQYLSDNVLRVCTGVLSDATAVGSAAGALVEKHGQLPAKVALGDCGSRLRPNRFGDAA